VSPNNPTLASAHGRVAALKRHHSADPSCVVGAERDLAAEKLAAYVAKVVAQAPPLTPAQRDRIAILLRGGAAPPGTTTTVRPDLGAQEGNVVRGGAA